MANRSARQVNAVNPANSAAGPTPPRLPGKTAVVNTSQTVLATSRWKSRLRAFWTYLGGVASIVAVVGFWYTHRQVEEIKRQSDLAEYIHLRATGGITAEMEFAASGPTPNDFGKEMRTAAFGGVDKPYYKNIATFLRSRPTLVLNNVGEEPIEAIKIVTSKVYAEVDLPNWARDAEEFGLALREEEREDITLSQQWLPETSVEISLLKGILGQMVQIQNRGKPNAMHKAVMQVQISGKISGSTVFGRGDDRKIMYVVWWMPTGFPADKCREVLNSYQPKIVLGPKRPVSIRRVD